MVNDLRLQAVRQFEELNLKNDSDLKYTVTLAAEICQTPISFVSIIDDVMERIKVGVGIDITEVPLSKSFCQYAMTSNRLFIVNDTLRCSFRQSSQRCRWSSVQILRFFPIS